MAGAEKLVVKFPQPVLSAFLWSMPYLQKLADEDETQVMEGYLKARWEQSQPEKPLEISPESICLLRLYLMTQASSPDIVEAAFSSLSPEERAYLAVEMARTGCEGQLYQSSPVEGGPAILIYYGPALLQRNKTDAQLLSLALRLLCHVYMAGRALWPATPEQQGQVVKVEIGQLKGQSIDTLWGDANATSKALGRTMRASFNSLMGRYGADRKVEGNMAATANNQLPALVLEKQNDHEASLRCEPSKGIHQMVEGREVYLTWPLSLEL